MQEGLIRPVKPGLAKCCESPRERRRVRDARPRLAVYAHPDDPEISAGGTLARWAAAGAEVHSLVTTQGDKGTSDPDADTDALVLVREQEAAAAATRARARVGASPRLRRRRAPRRHGPAPRARARRAHRAARGRAVPGSDRRCSSATGTSTTATTASPAGRRSTRSHPRRATRTTSPSCAAKGSTSTGRARSTCRARSSRTCWIDIADTLDRKIEALFCHASQLVDTGDWFRHFLRDTAEAAGRAAGITYAEGFRRIRLG